MRCDSISVLNASDVSQFAQMCLRPNSFAVWRAVLCVLRIVARAVYRRSSSNKRHLRTLIRARIVAAEHQWGVNSSNAPTVHDVTYNVDLPWRFHEEQEQCAVAAARIYPLITSIESYRQDLKFDSLSFSLSLSLEKKLLKIFLYFALISARLWCRCKMSNGACFYFSLSTNERTTLKVNEIYYHLV